MDWALGVIEKVAQLVLVLLVAGGVIWVMWAGWQWTSSGGNPQRQAEAKSSLMHSLFGLGIIICSSSIVNFVLLGLLVESGVTNAGVLQQGIDCDRLLRTQILNNAAIDTGSEVIRLSRAVSLQVSNCADDWEFNVLTGSTGSGEITATECGISPIPNAVRGSTSKDGVVRTNIGHIYIGDARGDKCWYFEPSTGQWYGTS